jgi:hypothetical protein
MQNTKTVQKCEIAAAQGSGQTQLDLLVQNTQSEHKFIRLGFWVFALYCLPSSPTNSARAKLASDKVKDFYHKKNT